MKTSGILTAGCVFTLALALTASARTVYDAGAALHANITSASPVGADGATYTDAQGGKWRYLLADDRNASTTASFGKSVTSGTYQGIGGNSSASGSPYIHVNVSGEAQPIAGAEPVEPDEFYAHPGDPNSGNHYVVMRFIVPEAGWYSAFISAHDVSKGAANKSAGAEVSLVANNVLQARSVVSLEDYEGADNTSKSLLTHRFDFQMPTRWMAADETIDVVIGANGAHSNDATGFKMIVTKEDAGAFYDSGRALNENVSGSSLNPFGTTSLGMWYCGYADTSDPQAQSGASASAPADAFASWAPGALTKKLTILDSSATRTAAPLLKGFFTSERIGSSPYICVNQTDANASDVAPRELYAHPHAGNWTQWTTLRFRPTRGGLYSASVVLRDVARNVATDSDGVMAYLLVAERVVTNAVVSAESYNATAHFTFDARLVAANEPIDIVISPHNGHATDSTTISAIFRREADVYDVGASMAALNWTGASLPTTPAHPFADLLGGGATWDVGTSTAANGSGFTTMPKTFRRVSNSVDYLGFGQTYAGNTSSDGGLPRAMLATNGVANLMGASDPKIYRIAPNEVWMHPNNANPKYPVIRAKVPSDGIYRVRACARDVSKGSTDGIRFGLAVGGMLSATGPVSLEVADSPSEMVFDAPRLWLKAGETMDAVVDPVSLNGNDGTGVGFCYVKEGEATAHVVNVHFTDRGTGKFSPTAQRPREGWSDWTTWNALRAGDAATASLANCFEANGETRHNVTVTLTRDSGAAIAKGSSNNAEFYSYVSSTDAADTYAFTVSKLAENAPYTLYLYSVKSASELGNAMFTVGGETKGAEETWAADGRKVLARFDATSDANGVITGTFAAADVNGGVFNGLTVVGDFPEYKSPALMIIAR